MCLSAAILVAAVAPVTGQSRGPLLAVTPSPVDFDTVFCGSSRCLDVVFRNAGDTALTVQEFDQLAAPFQGGIQTPFVLQPGETRSASWCYTPTRVLTRDSISAHFISDNRIPYSFGLLFDGSDAMRVAIPGAAGAIEAAHDAMADFVGTMMANGSPPHEAAVFAYSTSSQFRLLRGLSDDRNLVLGALPGTAGGAHACLWSGMDRSIGLLQIARHRRVLIVVNASEDAGLQNCGPYSAPGIASAALAANMLVYSISINGAAATALSDIAQQTGGLHQDVSTAAQLEQAMNDIMLHLQRAVDQQLIVRGEVVSPSLAFGPSAMLFPTTSAGDTARADIWIKNIGTSPMEIGDIDGETTAFDISLTKSILMPGDSLPASVSFHPTEQTYYTTSISMEINGCDPARPSLRLRGMSYMPVNPSLGPVLAIENTALDFGKIPCGTATNLSVHLRNVGDAVLKVFEPIVSCLSLLAPEQYEWNIDAGSESAITLIAAPPLRLGRDSCRLSALAIGRGSASTMVVIDAGSALRIPWQGTDGAGAARIAIGKLLAGLSSTTEIHDRIGVLSATKSGVQSLQAMTQDKRILASLIPIPGNSDSTSLLQAIGTALDTLTNSDGIRRLIILTAGSTETSIGTGIPLIEDLAQRVAETGTQVSALSFEQTANSDSLLAFLGACRKSLLTPASPDALPAMIDDIETLSVDTLRPSWMLSWTSVSSDIIATPTNLLVRESHPEAVACAEVTVRNNGEIPLEIGNIDSETSGFSSPTALPLVVAVGDSAVLRLCYRPASLGLWSLDAAIHTNSCLHELVTVHMNGEATDSNTVSLNGEYAVKPGSIVTLPVRLTHALPASYDIRRLGFSIGYDPSLLYPDIDAPLLYADGRAFGGSVTVKQEYDRSSELAITTYDVNADPLSAEGSGPVPFLALRLRAYLGRVLQTDVRLLSAELPGSVVALGYGGSASVRIDSMCWIEQRLVNASALWGTLGKNAPNPSTGRSTITYSLNEELSIRLALYDMQGRLLRVAEESLKKAGDHTGVLNTHGLPSGAYVCRLESSAGMLSRIVLVSNGEEK
jgi:hypothetical protein